MVKVKVIALQQSLIRQGLCTQATEYKEGQTEPESCSAHHDGYLQQTVW